MPGRAAEAAAVLAVAATVTLAIAAPVLRAPSERIFGQPIVGRHHDPFTVMAQFERPVAIGVHLQPVTDISGAWLARLSGGVAAYNWLVLLSFPLAAASAYLLARHLGLLAAGSAVAAMAYAFSPFHVAHAAYHPHIAQTQWMPLYLLALWRCLDHPSPAAAGFLGAAAIAVTLSNFYGGFIAAVITPFAVTAYWLGTRRTNPRPVRGLVVTAATLLLVAAAAFAYVSYAAPAVAENRAAFAVDRAELFRYSAKWWGYFLPPVAHPLLGATARRAWEGAGIREELLEHQVSLGWGIVALGLVAIWGWARAGSSRQPPSLRRVPVLAAVAFAALLCSLSPERTIGGFTFVRPAALLYDLAPMFRSYARFGLVVQLMAALLAGIGVDYLRRAGIGRARIAGVVLVALAAFEYAVAPPALWRDVLPTAAHRWVARQPGRVRALDCVPLNPETASVEWLTGHRVTVLGGWTSDCMEPNLPGKLAAAGYTHVLARLDTTGLHGVGFPSAGNGLRVAADFVDSRVFAVTARSPAIYTKSMRGFYPREREGDRTWRWMGRAAAWTIVNTRAQPAVAVLGLELSAFHRARRMELLLDGRHVEMFDVEPPRRMYHTRPLAVSPGAHELAFRPAEAPTVADEAIGNGDPRALSFAFGDWNWTVRGEQP